MSTKVKLLDLGFGVVSPEQHMSFVRLLLNIKRLAEKYNVKVKVEKEDPTRPLEIFNREWLVLEGEPENIFKLLRILRFKRLIDKQEYEHAKQQLKARR